MTSFKMAGEISCKFVGRRNPDLPESLSEISCWDEVSMAVDQSNRKRVFL